jgi:predicted transcriptional regulator
MTVHLSTELEAAVRRIAEDQRREVDTVVADAVRAYLESAAITDVEPNEIAATQEAMLPELTGIPPFHSASEADDDAAG